MEGKCEEKLWFLWDGLGGKSTLNRGSQHEKNHSIMKIQINTKWQKFEVERDKTQSIASNLIMQILKGHTK